MATTTWAHEHTTRFIIRGYVDPRWRSDKDNPADVYTKAISKETWDHLYRWFNDSTRMLRPPSARTALLKKQRLGDQNNKDLAESPFFSTFEMVGLSRVEQIANVEWQIS
jgi:hypothetical protein